MGRRASHSRVLCAASHTIPVSISSNYLPVTSLISPMLQPLFYSSSHSLSLFFWSPHSLFFSYFFLLVLVLTFLLLLRLLRQQLLLLLLLLLPQLLLLLTLLLSSIHTDLNRANCMNECVFVNEALIDCCQMFTSP